MSLTMAAQVVGFNKEILGVTQRPIGPMVHAEQQITQKCLREEVDEFAEAAVEGNVVKQVDALIDGIYFGLGALYKLGLTHEQIDECFAAVNDANMTKKKGVNAHRGDGSAADAVKPEGWVPPEERIAKILGL